MPILLRNHACQEYIDSSGNGKIIITGGITDPQAQSNLVWDYDIANDDYLVRNPLPTNVIHHRITKDHNDRLWILSGLSDAGLLPIYYIDLNSSEDDWKPLSNSKKRQHHDSWAFAYNSEKNSFSTK